ncbi:TPA: hypothetical protein R4057_002028 [Kluyvera ascorbata]|uniref:hypothetical protein n=1 Tax=Kluyvera ascorbata TaxID=51288 RepID=UPI0028987010|nr:hypothetical protein [Kluyvera ascorbata]HED3065075.1 hypothetical protein [Kluyvera ascorbata]
MSTEAAIKIFDPRTAKLGVSGGRSSVHWDDIAAMLATVERSNPVGYQLIMVKYRGDKQQEKALRDNVTKWARDFATKRGITDAELMVRMCQTLLDMQFHVPLSSQLRTLQHLHRLYGPYARRNATRIKALKKTLVKEHRESRIEYLEEQIAMAKKHINEWVIAHAAASTQCPRCRGTGIITLPQHGMCPACNGDKHIFPSHRDVVRHISANTSDIEGLWFVMDECRWWLSEHACAAAVQLNELFAANRES